jgi:hypothetical protein
LARDVQKQALVAEEATPMRTTADRTAQLGELVAAAFDGAARFSKDPLEVSRLGTLAVMHMLLRTPRCSVVPTKGFRAAHA